MWSKQNVTDCSQNCVTRSGGTEQTECQRLQPELCEKKWGYGANRMSQIAARIMSQEVGVWSKQNVTDCSQNCVTRSGSKEQTECHRLQPELCHKKWGYGANRMSQIAARIVSQEVGVQRKQNVTDCSQNYVTRSGGTEQTECRRLQPELCDKKWGYGANRMS
jgi:hypothetical protein